MHTLPLPQRWLHPTGRTGAPHAAARRVLGSSGSVAARPSAEPCHDGRTPTRFLRP